MSATKQELLSLKEDNLKLKENFKKFMKKHESNKKYITKEKVKEFVEHQEIIIENLNQKIENMIVKDENRYQKNGTTVGVSQKRKRSEIFPAGNENKASKRNRIEPKIVKNSLENFITTPGLQHVAENIFSYLNYQDITDCQRINRSSKLILDNPRFWLRKFIQNGMSKKNQNDWIKAIQLTKNSKLERNIYLYLKRSLRKEKLMNLPCYIDKDVIEKSAELLNSRVSLIQVLGEFLESALPVSWFPHELRKTIKKIEKNISKNSARRLQRIPVCPRQSGPKWADIFHFRHFQ